MLFLGVKGLDLPGAAHKITKPQSRSNVCKLLLHVYPTEKLSQNKLIICYREKMTISNYSSNKNL